MPHIDNYNIIYIKYIICITHKELMHKHFFHLKPPALMNSQKALELLYLLVYSFFSSVLKKNRGFFLNGKKHFIRCYMTLMPIFTLICYHFSNEKTHGFLKTLTKNKYTSR